MRGRSFSLSDGVNQCRLRQTLQIILFANAINYNYKKIVKT